MRLFRLTLHRKYRYFGSTDDLSSNLEALSNEPLLTRNYSVKPISKSEYKVTSKTMWGPVTIGTYIFSSLSCRLVLNNQHIKEENPTLTIKTRFKFEHVLIFTAFIIGQSTTQSINSVLLLLVVQVLTHILFGWLYRFQEISLVEKVQRDLNLEEVNGS